MLRKLWTDFIQLIFRRPSQYQLAALCWREHPASGMQVLLISSLTTKRWIIPKGWPKKGQDSAGTALEEAWEEAGIPRETDNAVKIGRYSYHKRLRGEVPVRTDVDVYAAKIDHLVESYPEAGLRKREWFSPEQAAKLVDEPQLATLLRHSPDLIGPKP